MKYDTSHIENLPKGLDPEIVKQTHKGKGWGKEDQARYDAVMAKRGEAKERAGNFENKEGEEDGKVYVGGRPGYYDKGGPGYGGEPFDGSEFNKLKGKPYQGNNTQISNSQSMDFNQDNDQEANFQGDNNYVYQNQDMSVRQYGGDNRSFVYNSNGEGPDTPATMATLAGYYAPDDSPAAQAKRLDQNVTMNRDNQKKYANTSYIAEGAIKRADRNNYIDPAKLDERIAARSQYHKDQSTIKGASIFGDIYGLEGPTWNSSKPAEEVEKPDFKKMYDTYTDF